MARIVSLPDDLEAEEALLATTERRTPLESEGAPPKRRKLAGLLAAAGVAGLFALVGAAVTSPMRGEQHERAFEQNVQTLSKEISGFAADGACRDAKEGDPCYFSVHWAMTEGVYGHPEWYKGVSAGSSFGEFQYSLYQSGAANCTGYKPCNVEAIKADAAKAAYAVAHAPPPGPRAQTFYMYRAQSLASYPLTNINTADLAGVFWYLHNEVVPSSPRKYAIDRIKRFKVTVKNTWEFWNAHKRQFGAFVAYDAGGCTTPVCKDIYHQYGFIVGCQVQPLSVAAYLGREQTNWQCRAGEDACKAPIWYSLPGPCPLKGIPNGKINPNSVHVDVDAYKTPECTQREPGGLCPAGTKEPTGAPDCTYTYEEAGEIFLDDLWGLKEQFGNYNNFWNASFAECTKDAGANCVHKKEYDPITDHGVGTNFWDGKLDKQQCTARLEKARQLFKKNFPQFPEHLEEPPCEFDMYYGDEFKWSVNHTNSPALTAHTNSPASEFWANRMA